MNKVKNIIDSFIGDLSSQSTLNQLSFSFFKKNMELIKDKNFKTEIEHQNENRKQFLECIKNLIDENIETIQKFIDEKNEENTLELDKILTIEEIIKKYNLDINYKKDIKIYMSEFGFTSFEVLTIKKTKKYIGNILIVTIGILEFCAGTALLYFSSNPQIFQLARFLIREGIKDVITGVKATINGEEISFKSYAIEKGISITCFALEYFTGNVTNIDNNFRDKLLSVVKGECFNLAKRYGNNYVANKIVKNLISLMSDKLKEYLITPLMNLITFNDEKNDKFIQFDIINDSDVYRNEILKRTQIILDQNDNIIFFLGH